MHGFSPEAMDRMQRYPWPGNVRELENCVERAAVLCRSNWVGVEDLAPAVAAGGQPQLAAQTLAIAAATELSLHHSLQGPERQIIIQALEKNRGNRNLTAAQLGINRTTLYKKMKKYDLLEAE